MDDDVAAALTVEREIRARMAQQHTALAGRVDEIVELVADWIDQHGRIGDSATVARLRGLGSEAPTEEEQMAEAFRDCGHGSHIEDCHFCTPRPIAGSGAPTPTEGPAERATIGAENDSGPGAVGAAPDPANVYEGDADDG